MIRVNARGKAYIAMDDLEYMALPHTYIDIPLLSYEGEVYTLIEYLYYVMALYNPNVPAILKKMTCKKCITKFLDRTESEEPRKKIDRSTTAKYPSYTTMKVTAVAHAITKQFIVDFVVTRANNVAGMPTCHRLPPPDMKRKSFVNLRGFAKLAQASNWCPRIFAHSLDRWINNVPKDTDTSWKEKAFISPDLVYLGIKEGNTLTSREKYKYGICVAKKKQKTRSDKIIVESNKDRVKPVTLYRELDGTYILRYIPGYVVVPVEGENKIIIKHE